MKLGSRSRQGRSRPTASATPADVGQRTRPSGSAPGAVGNAATGAALGDFFQYVIDHPVTLARQKSRCSRSSARTSRARGSASTTRPCSPSTRCSGLRFKNTSGLHLTQGPITVFEGSAYAGDTRVLDVQPNEERLVSYAIDLGTEVDPQTGPGTQQDHVSVKAVKGIVTTDDQGHARRRSTSIVNRSADGPHAADRAPEPHEPAVQAGGHRQAGRGHAGRVPLPDRR